VGLAFVAIVLFTGTAAADTPAAPVITEPATDGQLVHPADVHMEATGFEDDDSDTHACTDWEIWTPDLAHLVWHAPCATGILAGHIHLGDGSFVSPYSSLDFDSHYVLKARFIDSANDVGPWSLRLFGTYPPSSPGGDVPWTPVQPGYEVDEVAGGLQLPTNIAFVPNPGSAPGDPLLYISELYGTIKVLTNDGSVSDYATGLLNFNPTGDFPGSGETGLTGIVVDPSSGDVFASLLYDSDPSPVDGPHYPEVIRLHSTDGGRTAATTQTVLKMPGETQGPSHQISNLTFGPDGKLYVHMGDGFDATKGQDLTSLRGKILRLNLDGSAPTDNPLYESGDDGTLARDYIYAYGFRNPFGGAWRASNGAHYEVENGPSVDRLARVYPGYNYGYDGSNASMHTDALYNWDPSHAPVNIAFIQPQTFGGSGFPVSQQDHAFVTESGPTWATGPQVLGKRVVEFDPDPETGEIGGHPHDLVEYTGTGKATAVGLAAGPDGLYFTELYKDLKSSSGIDPGARLLRIRYGLPLAPRLTSTTPASPANANWPAVVGSAPTIGSAVKLYTDPGCTALVGTGTADQLASPGIQVHVPDNSTTHLYGTATVGSDTSPCSSPALTYQEESPLGAKSKGFNLTAAKRHCKKKFRGKARAQCIRRAKQKARAL
jgi:glucose/arabinose dehydrogenase